MSTAWSNNRSNRDAAIRAYREAIRADASDLEARLRFAFLMIEDSRLTEAESILRGLEKIEAPAALRYLGALVRARLAERQLRLDDALIQYSEAARLAPGAQTPTIARARIQLLKGHAADARALIADELPRSSSAPGADPWWRYPFGQTWRFQDFLDRLDKVVRPCAH